MAWQTIVLLFHVLGFIFFVGGQMAMVAAVNPVLRGIEGTEESRRTIAVRFGIGSAVALTVIVVSGLILAVDKDAMGNWIVSAKMGLLVLVLVLTGLHSQVPFTRLLSLLIFALSLVIVILGVQLSATI